MAFFWSVAFCLKYETNHWFKMACIDGRLDDTTTSTRPDEIRIAYQRVVLSVRLEGLDIS